jgi:4-carboxymuconolactone decarboxylase
VSGASDEKRRAARDDVNRRAAWRRLGVGDDARWLAPLPEGPEAKRPSATLPIEDEITAAQSLQAFGDVWSRPGLDLRTRSIVTIAVLTALYRPDELLLHVNGALNNGVTPDELHEVLLHAGVYSGIASWESALEVAHEVLAQRGLA